MMVRQLQLPIMARTGRATSLEIVVGPSNGATADTISHQMLAALEQSNALGDANVATAPFSSISGGAAGRVTCGCCWRGDAWAGQHCGADCLLGAPLRCSWLRTMMWRDGRLRRLGRCEGRAQCGHVRA